MGIIRILLAISVVLAHTSPIFGLNIVGGQVAVQSFYIISGFYMSLILNEKYIGKNNSYKLFLSNRLLRLYPIYWTILILILVRALCLFYSHGIVTGSLGNYVTYYRNISYPTFLYLIFTNIFLLGQDLVMFLGLNIHTGGLFFTKDFSLTNPPLFSFLFVSQAWTIGVEILFYILAPFLVRRNIKIIFLFILVSLLVNIFLVKNGLNKDPWTYRFFPAELIFFLLGSCSYRLYKRVEKIEFKKYFLNLISIFIILFTLFFNKIFIPHKGYLYFLSFSLLLPFIFINTKQNKFDYKIGELSYPIYISHMFVFSLVGNIILPKSLGTGLVVTSLTIILSIILNKFITNPIEKIRQKRLKSRILYPIGVNQIQ